MILIFRTTPLVEPCMAAAPSVVTDLHFVQSKPRSSINWLKLAEMAWAVAQTQTTFRQYKLCSRTVFFLIGDPTIHNQLHLVWNVGYYIKVNTKRLRVLQLVKKLFQQILWNIKTS